MSGFTVGEVDFPDSLGIKVSAKGHPKSLNSATFGIKISWSKIFLNVVEEKMAYALRPPLLIYAPKTII